jgi:hypothetical protein
VFFHDFIFFVLDAVPGLGDVLDYESTFAKSRFNITLGESGISLGRAYSYCRQMMLFCNRNA